MRQIHHKYEKSIIRVPGTLVLQIEIISGIYPEERSLYAVPICYLEDAEAALDQGRFSRFVDENLTYAYPEDLLDKGPHVAQVTLMEYFSERFQWIQHNTKGRWSFGLVMLNVSHPLANWFFEDPNDAMLYRLSF